MTQTKAKYELTFWGSATAPYFPRHKRNHTTPASIHATIDRVFAVLESRGLPTACHTPVIYDAAGHQISLPREA